MTECPDVSVVVPTYNRAAKLANCLAALKRQTIIERTEIVVVDDGSDDQTGDVVRSHGVRLIVHGTNRGAAGARNTGIGVTSAPIVAFTDDDCVPSPTWLESLLRHYSREDVLGVGGAIAPLQCGNVVQRYFAVNNPLAPLESELSLSSSPHYRAVLYAKRNLFPPTAGGLRSVYSLVSANLSVRRTALVRAGGFDETFRLGGEEEDLCRRLRALGLGELLFTPAAIVLHDFESGVADMLRRSYICGKGSAVDVR